MDLDRFLFTGDREAVPFTIRDRRIESREPGFCSSTEYDVEIRGGAGIDTESELHCGATFDDEEVAAIVVARIVEECTYCSDPHEVHDSLRQLPDIGGVAL